MKICRKLITFLLLFGIIANSFNYLIVSTSYQFNKSYISAVLCTNKNKPALHCEGKCFLDMKLKDLEKKNQQAQDHLKRIIETVDPLNTYVALAPQMLEVEIPKPFYLQQHPVKQAVAFFQPPKIV